MATPTPGKPPATPDPPLEPLNVSLTRVHAGIRSQRFGHRGDPAKNFADFISGGLLGLDAQQIGNAADLAEAYQNAANVDCLRQIVAEMDTRGVPIDPGGRANAAGVNALVAAQLINAALVTHMRATPWYANATLILVRSAIDSAVRGAAIAIGTGDEATRFQKGPKLLTEKERKAAEFKIGPCCDAIAATVAAREPRASPPRVVYSWLCSFTHLDAKALESPPTHEDAYAAIAYVSWLSAAVAELVVGVRGMASWPARWPAKLPWDP